MARVSRAATAQGRGVHGVEVLVKWGDRTLERCFVDGRLRRSFRLGGQGCDFDAHPRWLGAPSLDVVMVREGEAVVACNARARLRLFAADGAALGCDGGGQFALEPGQVARWDLGPLALEARWAQAPRAVGMPLADLLDYRALNILLAVAAVVGTGIGAAVLQGVEDQLPEPTVDLRLVKVARFVVAPEKQVRKVAQAADAAAEPASPRAARAEGASGERAQRRPRPGHAGGGPRSDTARARAALEQLFAGKSLSGVMGGQGLGDGLTRAIGGLQTASACVGGSCAGLGLRGDGAGGGGLERDLGSFGLHTQGRAGGNRGYGRGPGLARLGTGSVPACLIDEKTGRCQDTGPSIESELVSCSGGPGMGCLDKELIRRVIHQNLGGIRACYERALSGAPSLNGKVAVRFTIGTEGAVVASAVAQSTVGHPELERCIASRMQLLQFPRSRGVAVVTYPFMFRTSGT